MASGIVTHSYFNHLVPKEPKATVVPQNRNAKLGVFNNNKGKESAGGGVARSKRVPLIYAAATDPIVTSARRQRRPQNMDGEFFVDHTCIDCDTCRWMAPDIFTRAGDMSAVFKQPSCEEQRLKALQALISCPTNSIHTEKPARDILEVQKTFPIPISEKRIPGVYHCGYHSNKSYGAASYFIIHPQGNILIDSPRYTERLAGNIDKMGGVRYMFLTHKDDVADHDKWFKRFRCDRIMHLEDVESSPAGIETKLEGSGPWNLYDDVDIIHTPGHTKGSVCLFYKSLKILFTGDHLFTDEFGLSISEKYNFYSVPVQLNNVKMLLQLDFEWILPVFLSVPVQLNNVKMLLQLDFEWILPGHGRRAEYRDHVDKNSALEAFLAAKAPA